MGSINPEDSTWTPENVLSSLGDDRPAELSTTPLPFLHLLERLKTTKREGWRQRGLKHGESISDHMYRMAVMAMVLPPSISSKVDVSRCIRMALVHDMAECIVGDFTPLNTDITKEEKRLRESNVMDYIKNKLLVGMPGGPGIGNEICSLYQEYETNTTLEALLVHDIDKMEMIMQTVEYERRLEQDFSEFYHVIDDMRLPETRAWAKAALEDRPERLRKCHGS